MKNKIKTLFIVFLISFFISLFFVQKSGKKLNSMIQSYSTIEAERFGIYMINYSLDKDFLKNLDNDIFVTTSNSKEEIQIIEFKTKKVNELLETATKKVQSNLIKLENGDIDEFELANTFKGLSFEKRKKGVICEIPEGVLLDNGVFANNGPIIPIKLNFIGQVTTNIKTKVESYGINSVYFEASIYVEVKERVSMPLRSEDITVKTAIPIAMKIIQGTVPNYYTNPITSGSSQFSLPIS